MAEPASQFESTTPHAPYVGLRPYDADDREIFHGRERDATFVADRIFSSRLTLVYGRSGLGKSSLLRAMVIPELESGDVTVAYFDAWSDKQPDAALRHALAEIASQHGVANAAAGDPTLTELIRLLAHRTSASVILVLDQFEEFLSYHRDNLDPVKDELAELLRTDLDVRVVISMREENLAELEPFRRDILNVFQSTYRLEALSEKGLQTAIEGPLKHLKIPYDKRLTHTLISDLKKKTDSNENTEIELPVLPLLQLVCSELWELAKQNSPGSPNLTVDLYSRAGGCDGILRKYVISVVPRGIAGKRVTADLLSFLAPRSGRKMSYSIDDLADHSQLEKDTVSAELRRLEKSKILRIRRFPADERFELLHDAYIPILRPWITKEREAAKRRKRWFIVIGALTVAAVVLGTILIAYIETRTANAERRAAEAQTKIAVAEAQASQAEAEKAIAERHAAEAEAQRAEAERAATQAQLQQSQAEAEKATAERLAAEAEAERAEAERVATQAQLQQSQAEAEKATAERLAAEAEAQRAEAERVATQAQLQQSQAEAEKATAERLAAEAEAQRAEAERVATQAQLQQSQAEAEKAIAERLAAEAEAQRAEAERVATQAQLQQSQAEAEKATAERQVAVAETERAIAKRQAAEAEAQRAEAERAATAAQLQQSLAESEKAVAERQAAQAEADKERAERLAAEAEREKAVAEQKVWREYAIASEARLLEVETSVVALSDLSDRAGVLVEETREHPESAQVALVDIHAAILELSAAALGTRKKTLANLESVAEKNNVGTIPPTFEMTVDGSTVTLNGTLPDEVTAIRALDLTAEAFGDRELVDNLIVESTTANPDWLLEAIALVKQLKRVTAASMRVVSGELTLSGIALDEEHRNKLRNAARQVVKTEWREETAEDWAVVNNLLIPPTFAMSVDGSKVSLSGTLWDQETVDRTVATVRQAFSEKTVESELSAGEAVTQPEWFSRVVGFSQRLDDVESPSIGIANGELAIGGIVLNETVRKKVANEAKSSVEPVLSVSNKLYVPPTLVITKDKSGLSLSGSMPSQTTIDGLKPLLSDEVRNRLEVDDFVTSPGWLQNVPQLLAQLNDIESPAAMTFADGRLEIAGIVLNAVTKDRIGSATSALATGLEVDNWLRIHPTFSMDVEGARVTLSGVMPDQASIDSALAATRRTFPNNNVRNRLALREDVANVSWLSNAFGFAQQLRNVESPSSLTVVDRKATIAGTVLNDSIRKQIGGAASAALGSDLSVVNDLNVVPTLKMTVYGSGATLTGLMPDQSSMNRALEAAGLVRKEVQNNLVVDDSVVSADWLTETIGVMQQLLPTIESPAAMSVVDRELTITGTVLNDSIRQEIERAALESDLSVVNELKVPPTLTMEVAAGSKVTLSGTMPDSGSIKLAVDAAQRTFGHNNVTNNLSVGSAITYPDWLKPLIGYSQKLKNFDAPASLGVIDNEVTLAGTVMNEVTRQELVAVALASLPPDVKVNNGLFIRPTFAVDIERDNDERTAVSLTGEMPDQQSIDEAVRIARDTFGNSNVNSELQVGTAVSRSDWLESLIAFLGKLEIVRPPASLRIRAVDGELNFGGKLANDANRRQIEDEARLALEPAFKIVNKSLALPTLEMEIGGSTVVLTGAMPDSDSKVLAGDIAIAVFGEKTVENQLSITENITSPDWLAEVIGVGGELVVVDTLPPAEVVADSGKLTIEGVVLNETTRIEIGDLARESGLEVHNRLAFPKITFATESHEIAPGAMQQLDGVKDLLSGYKEVVISGHTDKIGDDEFNCNLSWDRARAVLDLLEKEPQLNHIEFKALGFSSRQPVTKDKLVARADRRIEFRDANAPGDQSKPCPDPGRE